MVDEVEDMGLTVPEDVEEVIKSKRARVPSAKVLHNQKSSTTKESATSCKNEKTLRKR